MGKAAILIVLAAGLAVTYGMASNVETAHHTAKHQAGFEERVLAREIARTGFNVAMGLLRQYGDDLQAGVLAINGPDGYLEGENQGGVFRTSARYISGHAVEVISTGYFGGEFRSSGAYRGGATFVMEDSYLYTVPTRPLHVQDCSRLNVQFLESTSASCSAVYMQRFDPSGQPMGNPEMIFAAGNNRNGGSLAVEKLLAGGTQLNFFIGVDRNCSTRPADWQTYDIENHAFNASDYDHIHRALQFPVGNLAEMTEAIWAMVEQHPANNQRWRIAWEDQHNTNWDRPGSSNPQNSLQATKTFGYDGNGWPETDIWGYRTLRDYSNRPDFSDQVINVWMTPATACASGAAGGGGEDDEGSPSEEGGDIEEGGSEEPEIDGASAEPCPCPNGGSSSHTVLLEHVPPGNPGNPQRICISENAVPHHLRNHHGDYVICRAN